MPSQIEKLQAHATHLLDGFLGLREKYSLLEPMLFDEQVVRTRGSRAQSRGFKVLRHTLFLTCAQDVAKLTLDAYAQSNSMLNITKALKDDGIRRELRKRYAMMRAPLIEEETDPQILALIDRIEREEEQRQQQEFDLHYDRLMAAWDELAASPVLAAFLTIRNKVSAHTDLHFVDGEYRLVDIGSLGINWLDLKAVIDRIQELMELVGRVVRNASFAWEALDRQLDSAAHGFWTDTTHTGHSTAVASAEAPSHFDPPV